ncbi:hypothetical protein CerSpe_213640 [Prunus speciosa]
MNHIMSKGVSFHKDAKRKKICNVHLSCTRNKTYEERNFVLESIMAVETSTWIMNSGASRHVCNSLQDLADHRKLSKREIVLRVGNGTQISAKAVSTFHLKLPHGETLELKECLYLPSCVKNLISISALLNEDYTITFNRMGCSLQQGNRIICKCTMIDSLYQIQIVENSNRLIEMPRPKRPREELNLTQVWHLNLGHIGQDRIQMMVKQGYLESLGSVPMPTCESCLQSKMSNLPFLGKWERVTKLLELIHIDVCGPLSTTSRGGFSYFITFTDDYSRLGYVYLIKYKSEVFKKFKEFKNEVEKQIGKSIKILRSDRGGEYLGIEFLEYLKKHGILSQWTPLGTP